MEFASHEEAAELAEIFYPGGPQRGRRRRSRRVPYDVLGINPPRDLAFKVIAAMKIAIVAPLVSAIREPQAAARRRSWPIWRAAWPGAATKSTFTRPPDPTSAG